VIPVKEIPMTVNGKKVETLVKHVISTGEFPHRISSTVANRHCLEDFKQYYAAEEEAIRARL
jgi:acetoacetyl-CoA synthetase